MRRRRRKVEPPHARPRAINDAPEAFSPASIREFLVRHGAKGVIEIDALSLILGTASPRTLRRHVQEGALKPLNEPIGRASYVFSLADVISWLMKNPQYIAQRRETWQISEATPALIRGILHKTWPTLLRFMEEEDIVSEVMVRMLAMPKTTTAEGLVITRALGKIYREVRRRPGAKSYREGTKYDD